MSNLSHTTDPQWIALKKAWTVYRIAKQTGDIEVMKSAATEIRKLQKELDVGIASFPHLGLEFY